MDLIIPFFSIIGVIIGFLLGLIRDILQTKPKINLSFKTGSFNFYEECHNEIGDYFIMATLPEDAQFMKLNLKVDIFNTGKGNTAIKEVDILIKIDKNFNRYFQPKMTINNNQNSDYSFNLPAGSILTLNLEQKIEKDEDTEPYFRELAIGDSSDKERLKIIVYTKDIKNRSNKVLIEPLSILTAE